MIPLANRSRTEPGEPGVCDLNQSKRAFLESGIDLESLVNFEPCELFNLIQKRTLWVFGDSQQHALFRSLFCFMSTFARTRRDIGKWGPIGIDSVDYVLTFAEDNKPECVELMNDTRICYVRITRLTHKEFQYTMEILARAIPMFRHHVVVFNVGLHYRPTPYLLSQDMQTLAKYRQHIRRTMGDDYLPLTLWIDTPPQHFSTPRGEYDTRQNLTTDVCSPFDAERLAGNDRGTFNSLSDDFVLNVSDAHVRTWDLAKGNHFSHLRPGDCTHYCRPGVPELWTYALTKTLAKAMPACG